MNYCGGKTTARESFRYCNRLATAARRSGDEATPRQRNGVPGSVSAPGRFRSVDSSPPGRHRASVCHIHFLCLQTVQTRRRRLFKTRISVDQKRSGVGIDTGSVGGTAQNYRYPKSPTAVPSADVEIEKDVWRPLRNTCKQKKNYFIVRDSAARGSHESKVRYPNGPAMNTSRQ